MKAGIVAVQKCESIFSKWAESIAKEPLQKGMSRKVMLVKDGVVETIGKNVNYAYYSKRTPDGRFKLLKRSLKNNVIYKTLKFPDGSKSKTVYLGLKPKRTNGVFPLKKKDGTTLMIDYGADGFVSPDVSKKITMRNMNRAGNPKYDVDLKDAFGNETKIGKFIRKKTRPVRDFFARFNPLNRAFRKLAQSIDTIV